MTSTTPAALRRYLADLGSQSASTERASDAILKAAAERRDVVADRIAELRPKALTDDAAGEEYMALIEERGQLDIVLAGS